MAYEYRELEELRQFFAPINVHVVSPRELELRPYDTFDLIGVLGRPSPEQLRELRAGHEKAVTSLMAFQAGDRLSFAKEMLSNLDAVVLCDSGNKDSSSAVAEVLYHFLASLVVPSLLNIDLADVRAIAKGMGMSLHVAAQDSEGVLEQLPKKCFLAKAALLHFSCAEDVSLKEVYDVSRAITLRRENPREAELQPEFDQHSYRKVNIKLGLRVLEAPPERISLTAILFGI